MQKILFPRHNIVINYAGQKTETFKKKKEVATRSLKKTGLAHKIMFTAGNCDKLS